MPFGRDEIKIFGERLSMSPGRFDQIQARMNMPLNILGEFFVVARIKYKQEELELEQCTVLKTAIKSTLEPLIEIRISESSQIPVSINGGEKVNFNVKILQNIEKTKLKVDVLAVGEEKVKNLKTFQIKQQQGEQKMYGVVNWETPQVSEKKDFYIDFKVYKDDQPLSDKMVKGEKKKITVTPA